MSARIDFNELEIGVSLDGEEWRPIDWKTLTINRDTEQITIVPVDESQDAIVLPYTSSELTAEIP